MGILPPQATLCVAAVGLVGLVGLVGRALPPAGAILCVLLALFIPYLHAYILYPSILQIFSQSNRWQSALPNLPRVMAPASSNSFSKLP